MCQGYPVIPDARSQISPILRFLLQQRNSSASAERLETNLELQPRFHLALQRLGDVLVEGPKDLHRQLGIDPLIADEVIEGISQSQANAIPRYFGIS